MLDNVVIAHNVGIRICLCRLQESLSLLFILSPTFDVLCNLQQTVACIIINYYPFCSYSVLLKMHYCSLKCFNVFFTRKKATFPDFTRLRDSRQSSGADSVISVPTYSCGFESKLGNLFIYVIYFVTITHDPQIPIDSSSWPI